MIKMSKSVHQKLDSYYKIPNLQSLYQIADVKFKLLSAVWHH